MAIILDIVQKKSILFLSSKYKLYFWRLSYMKAAFFERFFLPRRGRAGGLADTIFCSLSLLEEISSVAWGPVKSLFFVILHFEVARYTLRSYDFRSDLFLFVTLLLKSLLFVIVG